MPKERKNKIPKLQPDPCSCGGSGKIFEKCSFRRGCCLQPKNKNPAHFILRLKSLEKAVPTYDLAGSSNNSISDPNEKINPSTEENSFHRLSPPRTALSVKSRAATSRRKARALAVREDGVLLTPMPKKGIIKATKTTEGKMVKKKIETPAYWNEDRFQPLIEVTTIFGNTVKIPKGFKDHWDMLTDMSERIISAQGRAEGLKTIRELMDTTTMMAGKAREDFCKVFAEIYQEQN